MTELFMLNLTKLSILLIILCLIGLLYFIFIKLFHLAKVTIIINDKKAIKHKPVASLLFTLAQHKIYLASSCGGGGSCKRCKCQLKKGGGNITSIENDFFTQQDLNNYWRLACQVMVKSNMKITIDEDILASWHENVN